MRAAVVMRMQHRGTWSGPAEHAFDRHETLISWAGGLATLGYLVASTTGPQLDAIGHGNQGLAYAVGDGVERDDARALAHFELACEGGNAEGCGNLGAMLEQGRGTAADAERALHLYERACDGKVALACSNLGALYVKGERVEADTTYARQLFDWACRAGSAVGCQNLATLDEPMNRRP
jgi:TPR repeat protein